MFIYTKNKKYHYLCENYWDKNTKRMKQKKFYLGKEPIKMHLIKAVRISRMFKNRPLTKDITNWLNTHSDSGFIYEDHESIEKAYEAKKNESEIEKSNRDINRMLHNIAVLAIDLEKRPLLRIMDSTDKPTVKAQLNWLSNQIQKYLIGPDEILESVEIKKLPDSHT
jgi:hypothetical protein